MTILKTLLSSRRWFALTVLATICLSALLVLFAPQQVSVVHYKLVLTLLAGMVGYMLDRVLFPVAAPSSYLKDDWRHDRTTPISRSPSATTRFFVTPCSDRPCSSSARCWPWDWGCSHGCQAVSARSMEPDAVPVGALLAMAAWLAGFSPA